MPLFSNIRSWLARQIEPAQPPAASPQPRQRYRQKGMIPFKGKRYERPGEIKQEDPNERLRDGLQGRGGFGWTSDHREESEQYQGVVAIAVGTLVKAVGESSFTVEQKVPPKRGDGGQKMDRKPVDWDHPLAILLDQPNLAYGWDGLIKRIVLQRALTGSAFVWVVPAEEDGSPCELYVIPTALVTYSPPRPGMEEGAYRVAASGMLTMWSGYSGRMGTAATGWFTVDARHMIRISHLHPLTEMDGASPVFLNRRQIDLETETAEMMWSIVNNGAFPSALLTLAPNAAANADMVQAALEQAKEWIDMEYGGPERAGKMMPVYGMSVERLTWSLQEAVSAELRSQNRDMVLSAYQTPSGVVGLSEQNSYSGLHASRQQYVDIAVQPELTDIASVLTTQLAKRFGPALAIKVEAKPVNDLEQKQKEFESREQSQMYTTNECRAQRGDGPHPDKEIGKLPPGAIVEYVKSKFAQPQQPGMPPGGQPPALPAGPQSHQPQALPPAGGQPQSHNGVVSPGMPEPMRQNMPVHDWKELTTYQTRQKAYQPAPDLDDVHDAEIVG